MLAVERCSSATTAASIADHANAARFRGIVAVGAARIKIDRVRWGFFLAKKRQIFPIRCSAPGSGVDVLNIAQDHQHREEDFGDGGGGGKGGGGGGGDDGSGDGDGDDGGSDRAEKEFGSLLSAEEVERQVKARGAVLPADLAEAAKASGLRELILTRYLDFQAAPWPLGPAVRSSPILRNRMLADPSFLFKVLTEVAIDSGCATFAEVNKRGKDFWNEFELYMSDLLVGIVMDVALVTMLAPFVQFGAAPASAGRLSRTIKALPSSIFEAERPGRKFSVQQRLGAFFFKALQYGVVGFVCGLVGQGVANSIMVLKRKMGKPGHADVPVPPLVKSALLWAVFMGVSSNTRYQVINGLERVVEASPVAKRVPLVAMAFTVGVRFANNVYGGMQFVDWARMSGVQ
ncbi:protein RETICULATA-RELATED 1, chloroplastic [Selaginella moellendorffii]|nr:protein RETICULATA-RELATED 1, chloroplastic [Selaginella moellendorffii]|eukprot:XP_002974449.2 protein RETICULATA-RELATED 1, chloroplastic [Selaginella moellendorffii]